ncbi:MAG: hypothetical protein MJ133_06810 [Lachnospiraceae bacterium]|nr:hypothetical protein [Lachnospiraceae bacterium]
MSQKQKLYYAFHPSSGTWYVSDDWDRIRSYAQGVPGVVQKSFYYT